MPTLRTVLLPNPFAHPCPLPLPHTPMMMFNTPTGMASVRSRAYLAAERKVDNGGQPPSSSTSSKPVLAARYRHQKVLKESLFLSPAAAAPGPASLSLVSAAVAQVRESPFAYASTIAMDIAITVAIAIAIAATTRERGDRPHGRLRALPQPSGRRIADRSPTTNITNNTDTKSNTTSNNNDNAKGGVARREQAPRRRSNTLGVGVAASAAAAAADGAVFASSATPTGGHGEWAG